MSKIVRADCAKKPPFECSINCNDLIIDMNAERNTSYKYDSFVICVLIALAGYLTSCFIRHLAIGLYLFLLQILELPFNVIGIKTHAVLNEGIYGGTVENCASAIFYMIPYAAGYVVFTFIQQRQLALLCIKKVLSIRYVAKICMIVAMATWFQFFITSHFAFSGIFVPVFVLMLITPNDDMQVTLLRFAVLACFINTLVFMFICLMIKYVIRSKKYMQ